MSDGYLELAKMLTERNNPHIMTVGVGKVISPLPDIQIQFGQSVILAAEDVVISATVANLVLESGDEVIMIPTVDKQTFYVIDKVGG